MQRKTSISRGKPSVAVIAASCAANTVALALPLVLMQVYDRILPNENTATLLVLMLGLAAAIVIEFLLRSARGRLLCFAGARHEFRLSRALHRGLLNADVGSVSRDPVGVHMERFRAVEALSETRYGDGAAAPFDLPFALLFLGMIYLISPPLALVPALVVLVSGLAMRRILSVRNTIAEERSEIEGRRTAFVIELLGAIETIKSLGAAPFMERRYERLMAANARLSQALSANGALVQGVGAAAAAATPFLMAVAGAVMVIEERLTVGGLAAVILLANRVVAQMLRVNAHDSGDRESRRQIQQLSKNLTLAPQIGGAAALGPIKRIEARNLSLADAAGGTPVLRGVTFTIDVGEAIDLSGAVGSGKTALLNMLAGHTRPTEGTVLVNGVDIADCDPHSLRCQIAFLPQQHTLLEGTILDNMTRFRPDLHADEALEIAAALGLDRFFADRRAGLSAKVRRGVALGLPSAIVDRVALIGALVGRPRVILFDEANLSLDADGDARLRDYLQSRKSEVAMVLATQRPSYRALCSRSYRLESATLRLDQTGSDILRLENPIMGAA